MFEVEGKPASLMANKFDLFRSDDSYQTFKFQRMDMEVPHGIVQTWVISGTVGPCYEIKSYAKTTSIRCRGSGEDHIPAAVFSWGENSTVSRGLARPVSVEELLSSDSRDASQSKALHCGTETYNWCIDVIGPGECSYKLLDRQDPSSVLARLRVVQGVTGASFSLEVVAHIWLHGQMCNSIIAAVVMMCKEDDPWLGGAGSGLL